jgi:hypothetical protein
MAAGPASVPPFPVPRMTMFLAWELLGREAL